MHRDIGSGNPWDVLLILWVCGENSPKSESVNPLVCSYIALEGPIIQVFLLRMKLSARFGCFFFPKPEQVLGDVECLVFGMQTTLGVNSHGSLKRKHEWQESSLL